MAKDKQKDLGFGVGSQRKSKPIINKDGSFNVIKTGTMFSIRDTYQALIKMSWSRFTLIIMLFLIGVNFIFGFIYWAIGVEHIIGISPQNNTSNFLQSVYFSLQTFTTVGYGHLSPSGNLVSIIAAVESIIGLASFALMTSIIYGRFSKPSARLLYSNNALIAPYQDGKSLQFRVANTRMSMLLELQATVSAQFTTQKADGSFQRRYERLKLELDNILFFPLNWTLVHKLDDKSPLNGMTKEDFVNQQLELIIQIKGFDDTFGQTVHSRYSYQAEEIIWGGKFKLAYETDETGSVIFHIDQLHEYDIINID